MFMRARPKITCHLSFFTSNNHFNNPNLNSVEKMISNKLVAFFCYLFMTVSTNSQLLNNLIAQNFENTQILCYFHLNSNIDKLNNILMQYSIPIYVQNTTESYSNCEEIILCAQTVQDFVKFVETNQLKAHSRILLFIEHNANITDKLIEIAQQNALDIILISNFNRDSTFLFSNQRNSNKNLSATSVLTQKESTKFDSSIWSPTVWLKYNRTIRIALFHCPPYVIINGNQTDGIEAELLDFITRNWPVKYVIEREEKETRKNLFVAIIELAETGAVDMSVCGLWQRVIQERGLDMSATAISTMCLSYFVCRPTILDPSTFIVQPFEFELWFVCFGLILLITVLLPTFNRGAKSNLSLQTSFLYVMRYFSLGAVDNLNVNRSTNYLLTSWCSFCLILSVYYSAGITILFRFPQYTNNIDSYEEIVDLGLKWEEPADDIRNWLADTGDPLYEKLANLFIMSDNRTLMNHRLRSCNYVFLVKVLKEKYIMNAEELDDFGRSHLRLIQKCLATFYSVIAFKKNSPLVKVVDRSIVSLLEHGFINYWHLKFANRVEYRYMKRFFILNEDDFLQQFDLPKLKGSFYLLVLGYLIAALVFFVECVIGKKK